MKLSLLKKISSASKLAFAPEGLVAILAPKVTSYCCIEVEGNELTDHNQSKDEYSSEHSALY